MSDRESEARERAMASGTDRQQAARPREGDGGLELHRPLPRGRHGIPAEEIAEHQRARLRAAVGSCLAEGGYGALSAAEISRRAGVSRLTFYKHYADKLDCILDAQRVAFNSLEERLSRAAQSGGTAELVGELVAFAASDPTAARLTFPCGPTFAAPAFADRTLAFNERLAARLMGDENAPAGIFAEAAAGGLVSVIAARLAAGEAGSLPELGPELHELTVALMSVGDKKGITLAA